MDPKINSQEDVDPIEYSPLVRGMLLTMHYAKAHNGIQLTRTGRMNRKFLRLAVPEFDWPRYTRNDVFGCRRWLNEAEVPPMTVVRVLLQKLRLLRRKRNQLHLTRCGLEMIDAPDQVFERAAYTYLYQFAFSPHRKSEAASPFLWDMYLDIIDKESEFGCTVSDLMKALFGPEVNKIDHPDRNSIRAGLLQNVIRPVCWLGLLSKAPLETGPDPSAFYKTPLWQTFAYISSDKPGKFRRLGPKKLHFGECQ
ncbi:hypothetical protein [Roseibium sp. ROS1]